MVNCLTTILPKSAERREPPAHTRRKKAQLQNSLQVAKMVANILLEHLGMLGDIGIEYATILIVGQFLTCPEHDKRGWLHGTMQ